MTTKTQQMKKSNYSKLTFLGLMILFLMSGNIYAQEIPFFAKVSPKRRVKNLTKKQKKDLYLGIKKILKLAVKKKGSSISDYRDARGRKGGMESYLKVYGRHDKKCLRCKNVLLKKESLFGRGTVYCPKCQK